VGREPSEKRPARKSGKLSLSTKRERKRVFQIAKGDSSVRDGRGTVKKDERFAAHIEGTKLRSAQRESKDKEVYRAI